MNCKICNTENKEIFEGKILNKYNIKYFHCEKCGFLQTQEPHWLSEAYQDAINIEDTGILQRNNSLSNITSLIILYFFDKKGKFVDISGGYGILVRLLRDMGFDFYWNDLYCNNIFAKGFEYKDNEQEKIELITCFEAFEHYVNPLEEIEKIMNKCSNILFTTSLLPNPVPPPNNRWYYGLSHGQHISFYSYKTLEYIANKYNLNLYSNGKNIHLFTNKKINKTLFKINLKISNLGINKIISKLLLKSKTIQDMNYITTNKNTLK